MNNRENTLRALRRDKPERVPFDFSLCPSLLERFQLETGQTDYMKYFDFPFRYVELQPTTKKTDYSGYYSNLPANARPLSWNPEWGVMSTPCDTAHFEHMLSPMTNIDSVDEIMSYPFPDLAENYRWEGVKEQVAEMINNDLIAVAFMQMTLFEISWYLRGIENFLIDMLINEDLCVALLDRVTKLRCEMARRYAKAGVDILMLGDDVSTQETMMIAKPLWQKYLKGRLEEVIRSAKEVNPEILIFYHGDGNLQDIIPDLIEIGVDILNPIQPECMDPVEIKRQYGNKISFWGTIGTQTTMPFGTPKDVKAACQRMIQTVGRDGGLLLAPTHLLEPEVPWENIKAFIEAVQEYGVY